MSTLFETSWPDAGRQEVPQRYRGVWARTLLDAPGQRDDTSFVRWLQTSVWHADLRVPQAARATDALQPFTESDPQRLLQLAVQQGFCGVTEVRPKGGKEVCTWHRRTDFQPSPPGRWLDGV